LFNVCCNCLDSWQFTRIRSEDINSPDYTYHPTTPDNPFVEDEEDVLPSIVPNDFQFRGCIGDDDFGDAFKAYHDSCLTKKNPNSSGPGRAVGSLFSLLTHAGKYQKFFNFINQK